jgi:hypothetical protein
MTKKNFRKQEIGKRNNKGKKGKATPVTGHGGP